MKCLNVVVALAALVPLGCGSVGADPAATDAVTDAAAEAPVGDVSVADVTSEDGSVGKIPPGWIDPSGGAPATACERTLPIDGSPCSGSLECPYPGNAYCSGDSAKCDGGVWRVTLGVCAKCPLPSLGRPADGSPCGSGKGCRFLNACGGVDTGQCVGGVWKMVKGACHKACPPARPVDGSACTAVSADTCSFAGTECSTSNCACVAYCPTVCADGVVLKWFCPEPSCGPVYD